MEKYTEPTEKIVVDEDGSFALPEEKQIIFDEILLILDKKIADLSNELADPNLLKNRQKIIRLLEEDLRSSGVNPEDYILWHKLNGSGFHNEQLYFDTEDGKIENFIKETYNKA